MTVVRASQCLVCGSINIDEYFHLNHIVRPGETIASTAYERRTGGKGANQAVAVARAGGRVVLDGRVGRDGENVVNEIHDHGVDVTGVEVVATPTGRALIQLAEDGENSIILFPGANCAEPITPQFDLLSQSTHLILQNEIPWTTTTASLELSRFNEDDSIRQTPITVIFNPSPVPSIPQIASLKWEYVDWLIVNKGEAIDVYNALQKSTELDSEVATSKADLVHLGTDVSVLLPLLSTHRLFSNRTSIVCTLGAEGVVLYMPRDMLPPTLLHVPAAKLEGSIRDSTGAGDCFAGYFVQGLMDLHSRSKSPLDENDMKQTLQRCAQAAGMCVERHGTIDSIPTSQEVDDRKAARSCGH